MSTRKALSSFTLAALAATVAPAGPIHPPAGPVAPTYRTLTEVEPRTPIGPLTTPGDDDSVFKITQPGSYYLAGPITGESGKHGIEIVASNVTLDLNGFELLGVAGSLSGSATTEPGLLDIQVTNGSARAWGGAGIDLAQATRCQVDAARCSGNATGIRVGGASTVSECVAGGNTGAGIDAGFGCIVTRCASHDNDTTGIAVGHGSAVHNCTVFGSGSSGISAITGTTVIGCAVRGNAAHGITVSTGCLIADCTASSNGGDGIRASSGCTIRGNVCFASGVPGDGAGVHVTSSGNRIEGNQCLSADRGIDADSSGNFIARNICSGNTLNWDVVMGNAILVVQASSAPAVSGNTGGAAPASMDPNVNFTY
jgi:parallel beta-helix repeat protein